MAREFLAQFHQQSFSKDQLLVFRFKEKALLRLVVKELEACDVDSLLLRKVHVGQCFPNTTIMFNKADGSSLNLIGKSKGKSAQQSIINPDWDLDRRDRHGWCERAGRRLFTASDRIAFAPTRGSRTVELQARQGNSALRSSRNGKNFDAKC